MAQPAYAVSSGDVIPDAFGTGADGAAAMRLRAAAHEIRTPLTGAATIVDILVASEPADSATRDYVLLLKDALAQIIAVTNDILDLGRLEADFGLGPREGFSPAALLASIVDLARPRIEAKGIHLALDLATLPDRVIGHPVAVRRAVENLVDNAGKHTPAGQIRVEARLCGERWLEICVADTGDGMDPADVPRLFEPYVQLAGGERAGGTGLGLPLVKAAVERIGGSISVETTRGSGTRIGLRIPVDPAEAVLPASQRLVAPRRPLGILVAEDNPVNRIVIGAILGEFGHRTVFSPDGQAAVDSLRRDRYDLVLMDIEMPGLDGPSALAKIRALPGPAAATPVIALSARGEEARRDAMARGFGDYVVKPIDPQALFLAIEAATASAVGRPD